MNIVVLGTSVMWGQGLEDADKIHTLLAQKLQDKYPTREINTIFLAHSGAFTGYNEDGTVDTQRAPRLHGEVPTPYPTILQQIEEFNDFGIAADAVDVVVLDAGVNDVNVDRILNPFTSPEDIKKLVNLYCDQHMKRLVELLLRKFKNARIVIGAYYEFISEESEEGYLRHFIESLANLSPNFITELALKTAMSVLKQKLILNCDVFVEYSQLAFETIVKQMNTQHERVLLANPDIKNEHATFASDPFLFGINNDLSPQDPLAEVRNTHCDEAGISRTPPIICERASMGHPNPKGAVAYAEAIFAVLQQAEID